jgi:hypothetical protein
MNQGFFYIYNITVVRNAMYDNSDHTSGCRTLAQLLLSGHNLHTHSEKREDNRSATSNGKKARAGAGARAITAAP